jgi:hypothetical protein
MILLRHLGDLFLVAVLLGSAFGFGAWLLNRIGAPPRPVERLLFFTVTGVGALGVVLLALGSFGLLSPLALWLAVLGCGLLGWRDLRRLPELLRACGRLVSGPGGPPGLVAGLVLLLAGAVLLLGAFAPITDWDSLMYHLEIPRRFLEEGRVLVPEDNLHVAFLGTFHMLYLPLMAVGGWAGPALLNGAFALLLGIAVLAAGDRFFDRTTGLVGMVALWGTSSLLLVASTPRNDVTVALFIFLVHYGILAFLDAGEKWGLWAAALLGGLAFGVKYHALAYFAALAPVAVWGLARHRKTEGKGMAPVLGGALALFLVAALPAAVKNQWLLGGALYPFFSDPIVPPWLAELLGSRAHPPEVSLDVYDAVGQAREPVTLGALLFNPAGLTVEVEGRSFVTNPILFLLPLSLLVLRDRMVAALLLPAIGYLLILIVPIQVTNLRYLIPAIPALTLVSVEGARRLGGRFVEPGRLRAALLVAGLVALVPGARGVDREMLEPTRMAAGLGLLTAEEYLLSSRVPGFPQYFQATRWVGELTPADARIVLLFEARGYYFDRTVLQDNRLVNWPLLQATEAWDHCLANTGITHILVNTGAAAYYQGRGTDLGLLRMQRFPAFADRCLELRRQEGGFELYRVRP